MKTKTKILFITVAITVVIAGGVYIHYKAMPPKGKATGVLEAPKAEIKEIDKIFRVADINGDKLAEIILLKKINNEINKAYVIDNNGNRLFGWPKEIGVPAIGDVNNDGYKEMTGLINNELYVYDQFGGQLTGFPVTLESKASTIPALINLEEENTLDIICGGKDPNPCFDVFRGDGYLLPGWPKEIVALTNAEDNLKQADIKMPMAVADINNDGKTEVVAFAYNRIFIIATEQNNGRQ